jgi:HlyD family secretion protein
MIGNNIKNKEIAMYKLIKELFQLLTPSQRKRFYILQFLVIIMAFTEILGITSIAPFMALVGDMSILEREGIISKIYEISGVDSPSRFVFIVGIGVLITLSLSTIISTLTTWRLSMFASKVGSEISDRLYAYYLKQNWLYHASGSSAQLIKKISNESTRMTFAVLQPLMMMNAKIVLAIFMSSAILIYNPKVAIIGLVAFSISYIILYKFVKNKLQRNGQEISDVYEKRFRLMNEGFGGIKDILLLGRNNDYIKHFEQSGRTLAYSEGTNIALSQVPRYFMELIAFGSMLTLLLYLITAYEGNLGLVLPILSVYALTAFKLLPAFQQIYSSISSIKGNISAFESIRQDLIESKKENFVILKNDKANNNINPVAEINLIDICFTYPSKTYPAINNFSLKIKANSVIGIVGPSGSGKSTFIDILLGLITPNSGRVMINGKELNEDNMRTWQNNIGFVAQSIFLSEGTIAENIALGIPKDEIDNKMILKALNLANLAQFVESLDEGIQTKVGERGVQLSGGQRQRIGIARALYHDAKVLVFDEATSSLDGITEKLIMEAIHDFSGKKTIIMIAHRLKTVQRCDYIFFIDKGKVTDSGSYNQLLETNEKFRKMARHA